MKKQLALALAAALLAFPVTPSLVMADTTAAGTTTTSSTTQPVDTSINQTTSSTSTATTTTPDTTSSTGVPTDSTTTTSAGTTTVVDQTGVTVDPGTLPDSPWYWFQTLIEKIKVALTFDPVKKADLTENQALENLAEAQALINKGDTTGAEKALTEYSNKVEKAQAFLDQLKDPNSETAQKVQAALNKVNTNNMVVLGGLLEKLPPQAAQKLALNIVRSVEKAVARAEKMDNKEAQAASTGTSTDSATAAQTSTSTLATASTTSAQTGTADQAQLRKQARQALEQFQIDLGLKKADHTPNGNAYGYYQNKKAKDNEDSTQTVQQQTPTPTQAQTQQGTQQYSQAQQPQVNQSAKNIAPEKHNTEGQNENQNKGEKGNRD